MADNNNVRKRVAANGKVNSFEYEVFGKVQKVGFRVMMNKKMKEFKNNDVSGSAINTKEGTVKGIMFGNEENLEEMKNWLKNVGSPRSRIDKCEIKNIQKQVERGIVGAHFFFLQRNINSKVPTQYKLTL